MPTYEYFCPSCGLFEHFQGMNEAALEKCPKCGSGVKRRISGGAGFIFKGSGFYATEYRSSEYVKREKEERSAADARGSGSGGAAGTDGESKKSEGSQAAGKTGNGPGQAASGNATPPAGGATGPSAPSAGGSSEPHKPVPPTPGS